MPAPDWAMVRIINPASRMPRPAAIFLGDADAEPAVLRERGDEFLRKPSVVVTFQPVVVTKAAGYAGNGGDEGLLLLAQTEIHSRTTLVLFPRA